MDELAPLIAELLQLGEFELRVPGRGNLNYSYLLDAPDGRCFFIKHFGERLPRANIRYRARRARYQVEKRVLQSCNRAALPTPQLIAFADPHLLLIQEHLAGEDLHAYLAAGGDRDSLLYGLGLWLGCFHTLFAPRACATDLQRVGRVRLGVRGRQDDVQPILATLASRPVDQLVFCRNDCHPGNFIVRAGELLGVDFEMCSYQPAGIELASLLVGCLRAGRQPAPLGAERWLAAAGPLLAGYREVTGADLAPVLPAYLALQLLKRPAGPAGLALELATELVNEMLTA